MVKRAKKLISIVLCLSLLLSFPSYSFASQPSENGDKSYFDFEATEYEVGENDGTLKVNIVRQGEGNDAADVAFKVADFLSSYGDDYEVLDSKGKALEKIKGQKPSVSDLKYNEETEEIVSDTVENETSISEDVEKDASIEESENDEVQSETALTEDDSEAAEEEAAPAVEESKNNEGKANVSSNTSKKAKSTGSSLHDARNQYLNVQKSDEDVETENAVKETIDDMYNYFLTAEGASGVVHFKKGENKKSIIIKIKDNDKAEQNKIFMIALMGTDNDKTMTSANATTYVTIIDDEETEAAEFDLAETSLTLTSENPEGYVTVRRTGGTQYFANVYVSTVNETADKDSYESFEYKVVSFVPGEIEKKVQVKATDFSRDGKFGVRLEAETGVEIGNYYTTVNISGKEEVETESAKTTESEEASLMASNVVLGSANKDCGYTIPEGWKKLCSRTDIDKRIKEGTNPDNKSDKNTYLHLQNCDKDGISMVVSKNKINLAGIKNIDFKVYITNSKRGFNTKHQGYMTYFQTSLNQEPKWTSLLDSWNHKGNLAWTTNTLSLNNSGDSAYLKFGVHITNGGFDNGEALLSNISYNYAKYTFNPQNSAETFTRKIYDFYQGTPNVYDTYFDGEEQKIYNPGTVVIKSGNDSVSGFYGGNTSSVTITAADEEKNEKNGLYLKGVYFAKNDKTAHTMFENRYTTSNVYYVAATDGKVTITPDQNFVKTLKNKGVIGDIHDDDTIKIFPVFGQEMVDVHFENTDRDDSKSATKGKYDSQNKASYILNVIEAANLANNPVKVEKKVSSGWLDYYNMTVPKGSIIRVKSQPASNRTASGIYWWSFDGKRTGITYYKGGEKVYSGSNPQGDTIQITNYSKGDVVATENLCIKPLTGKQTLEVKYFPTQKESIPDVFKGTDGLKNAVVVTDSIASGTAVGTDESGNYSFSNAYTGMKYSLTAIAPNGYYTQWVNMTGDNDEDGYVSKEEQESIKNKGSMPDEVYGNKIIGTLDQDNLKLNYYFLPKTNLNGTTAKTGKVVRKPETFYQLANNITSQKSDIPLSAVWVDIGGFTGMTKTDGSYSILCQDLPAAGDVSTTVTVDGYQYNTISKLQKYTYIELPALSKFNVKKLNTVYKNTKGGISGDFITVNDDTLTISATVSSDTSLVPKKAHFYIYDNEGNQKFDLEGKNGYETTVTEKNGQMTATLSFNPKKDMQFGYKIYVKFADQNNEWTNLIDLGYYFTSKLNLAEFLFPLIGSSSLENTIRTGVVADIIGDPLGDMDLGKISGFTESSYSHTPSGINQDEADAYTWQNTDYSFGWSKSFGGESSTTSAESDEAKLKDFLKKVYDGTEKGANVPGASKFATKSSFSWSVTPSVGFKLTISSRKDGNAYFEDLVFYAKVAFEVGASQTISLPVGISILIKGNLSGDIAGIYHMYVEYGESTETEDAVKYTAEDFGLFKKFSNSVRREGYIFLDPKVSVTLGVGYGVVFVTGSASFDFDMDFQFKESDINAYGDITIDLGWGIEMCNFEVYSKTMASVTEKLFNTKGTDAHIGFDYATQASLSQLSVEDYFSADEEEDLVLDKTTSREYLSNRSEWLGDESTAELESIDASNGTTERWLLKGTSNNPDVKLADIGDGKVLMVFVDDDISRTDENKRAVYYSLCTGKGWTLPELIDDDGTLDDYPNISDLGDGRLLVTWSSADKVLEEGATVEDALKSMNIKAAFFDIEKKEFGKVMQVTKTTDGDYCADTMANAAYDKESGNLILYYTKTEYDNLKKVGDVASAYSTNAYMFYKDGSWSNADDYTQAECNAIKDNEQSKISEAEWNSMEPGEQQTLLNNKLQEYKDDWYGQRFLDVRISKNDEPKVIDTTAIDYNGLALFAWTVDWDNNLNTLYDRDVFMQIYDFNENIFTHIIRVTTETAAYSTPKFARSDNATYLFYGENAVTEGGGTETKLSEHGAIRYLNVSDLIKNEKYTEVKQGDTSYYIFKYTEDAVDPENAVEIIAEAGIAAECDNPMDYDVTVTSEGQMYLFWTDSVDDSRQILTAAYNGSDEDSGEFEEIAEFSEIPEIEEINLEDSYENTWSEPIIISNANKNEFYSGIGAAVVKGMIFAVASKGDYKDETKTTLVNLIHRPYSKAKVTELEIMDESPQAGSTVTLNATIKNEGLETIDAATNPIIVGFTLNGESQDGVTITKALPGGMSTNVLYEMTLPDEISDIEFGAFIDDQEPVVEKLEQKIDVQLTNSEVKYVPAEGYNDEKVVFSGIIENNGNADVNNITVRATVGEKQVGSLEIAKLAANETKDIDMKLSVSDGEYNLDENGIGTATVKLNVISNDESIANFSGDINKVFNKKAIDLLSKVTDVKFSNDGKYSIKPDSKNDIQPEIKGVENNSLMVMWLDSSNEDIAYINYDNQIVGVSNGSAEFTGIVVPTEEIIELSEDTGNNVNWKNLIPSDKLITVKMTVNVAQNNNNDGASGNSERRNEFLLAIYYNNNKGVYHTVLHRGSLIRESLFNTPEKEGYIFDGWYTDKACSKEFDYETNAIITSDLFVYAKWKAKPTIKEMYTDISSNDWCYKAINYVSEKNLMNGVSEDLFEPDTYASRAMLLTTLYRAEGQPDVSGDSITKFTDIEKNSWYSDSTVWGVKNNIINGVSETKFAPNENITREQLATIVYRYKNKGAILASDDLFNQIKANDASSISDYAKTAMGYCYSENILVGDNKNNLNPKNNLTRAEMATVIMRLCEKDGFFNAD